MNAIDIVTARMRAQGERPALHWRGRELSYNRFFALIDEWLEHLARHGIGAGTVCGVFGDYSPATTTLFFALMRVNAIIVPFTVVGEAEMGRLAKIAGVECLYRFDADDTWTFVPFADVPRGPLVASFVERRTPGLIVFTSGSTGEPKAVLHDCERVMRRFVPERRGWSTVLFLMMDHIGGFNTLLGAFAYGGVAVCLANRSPETVCRANAEAGATLLPTTPTFLNLMIASGTWKRFDLSSFELITYGTEVMPQSTLARVKGLFPSAAVKQTYGLSELGILRSKSQDDQNTWLKVGGDGFEVKIVDDILWVRSESNMVGYLNAPSPFDDDGWMCTGDEVEIRGDMIRFVGRKSEVINVGGQKVFPVEVEAVLLEDDNVSEATVFGTPHVVLGQAPCARISLQHPEDRKGRTARLRRHCRESLAKYKVPMRFIVIDDEEQRSERFKKVRG